VIPKDAMKSKVISAGGRPTTAARAPVLFVSAVALSTPRPEVRPGRLEFQQRQQDVLGPDVVVAHPRGLDLASLLAEAARPCRHAVGDRWFVDETSVMALCSTAVKPSEGDHGQGTGHLAGARRASAACPAPSDRYFNNRIGADHGARVVIAGHALVQNLRRDHNELADDQPVEFKITKAPRSG
jgi:hypothetical protein